MEKESLLLPKGASPLTDEDFANAVDSTLKESGAWIGSSEEYGPQIHILGRDQSSDVVRRVRDAARGHLVEPIEATLNDDGKAVLKLRFNDHGKVSLRSFNQASEDYRLTVQVKVHGKSHKFKIKSE